MSAVRLSEAEAQVGQLLKALGDSDPPGSDQMP